MSRGEKVILTNMCMVYDGDRILVQNRIKDDWKGITFPGGHVEINESFVDSVKREVREETGLTLLNVSLKGLRQWSNPKEGHRYIVFLFSSDSFTGKLKSSSEGEVFWVKREELNNLELAEGFIDCLEIFDNDLLSENYYFLKEDKWIMENK